MALSINHTVVVVCFNQQDTIEQALDSLLEQSEPPFQIVVGDDASTDNTPAILRGYAQRHPDLFDLVLRNKNLGIFQNLDDLAPRAKGDLVSFLAGDDWYKPDTIRSLNEAVLQRNLAPDSERFVLVPQTVLYKDGIETALPPPAEELVRSAPAVSLALRDRLVTRYLGLSRALIEQWPRHPANSAEIGWWADYVHFVQLAQHIDLVVPLSVEGPVYRMGAGVSSKTRAIDLIRSYNKALADLCEANRAGHLKLDDDDQNFLRMKSQLYAGITFQPSTLLMSLVSAARLIAAGEKEVVRTFARTFAYSAAKALLSGKKVASRTR